MKYFVIMRQDDEGNLKAVGRRQGYGAIRYTWTNRKAAEKHFEKIKDQYAVADIFSLQGLEENIHKQAGGEVKLALIANKTFN